MIAQDDRTESQQSTHTIGIVAVDTALSGWSKAEKGLSVCAWACAPEVDTDQVLAWVESRSEMERVEIVDLSDYTPPSQAAHFHIYVCNEGHPATIKEEITT